MMNCVPEFRPWEKEYSWYKHLLSVRKWTKVDDFPVEPVQKCFLLFTTPQDLQLHFFF
jgi:hypothetical protein